MKNISLFLATSLVSIGTALAVTPEVKVTSFSYLGQNSVAAELCAKVTGLERSAHLQVIADPNSSKPATYNVHSEPDGNFCVVVATFTGKAKVTLLPAAAEVSENATVTTTRRLPLQQKR